ncbi:MAG: DUF1987 domain-containing protein [Bacteroidales bacterium]|nr:DUF1987 domain-containing protein [Bacteroidales bacterium]
MTNLLIEPTKKTPLVDFSTTGKLVLAGNAQAENAKEFFDPVFEWINNFQAEKVHFDILLDYINTASAKRLFDILKKLDSNSHIQTLEINWFYEAEDADHLETGQILAEMLKKGKFNYKIYEK